MRWLGRFAECVAVVEKERRDFARERGGLHEHAIGDDARVGEFFLTHRDVEIVLSFAAKGEAAGGAETKFVARPTF
jgi:hypothetical protein